MQAWDGQDHPAPPIRCSQGQPPAGHPCHPLGGWRSSVPQPPRADFPGADPRPARTHTQKATRQRQPNLRAGGGRLHLQAPRSPPRPSHTPRRARGNIRGPFVLGDTFQIRGFGEVPTVTGGGADRGRGVGVSRVRAGFKPHDSAHQRATQDHTHNPSASLPRPCKGATPRPA